MMGGGLVLLALSSCAVVRLRDVRPVHPSTVELQPTPAIHLTRNLRRIGAGVHAHVTEIAAKAWLKEAAFGIRQGRAAGTPHGLDRCRLRRAGHGPVILR